MRYGDMSVWMRDLGHFRTRTLRHSCPPVDVSERRLKVSFIYHLLFSAPGVDIVPTFTTNNDRMCLVLRTGQLGLLRIEDAERLQVRGGQLEPIIRVREDLTAGWVIRVGGG